MATQLAKVAVTAIMVTAGGDGGDVTMIALSATFINSAAMKEPSESYKEFGRPTTKSMRWLLDGSTLLKIPEN